ncbi:MAG: DUF4912 domain-containing protein [Opitutaceae bacterium]|nr:DUF4912 domain-containing protein [Opitutaceae bacterium]
MNCPPHLVPPERLRDVSWQISHGFPRPFQFDQIHFTFVQPRLGFLWWHVGETAAATARRELGSAGRDAEAVVRIYDVTSILFDGLNAHSHFDLRVDGLRGNYYLHHDRLGRSLLAEVGLRVRGGAFHALARSAAVCFDRDRPSHDFRTEGLFVARDYRLVFPVENFYDARLFERMSGELAGAPARRPLHVAAVYLGWGEAADFSGPLGAALRRTGEALGRMGTTGVSFGLNRDEATPGANETPASLIERGTPAVFARLEAAHRQHPFDLVHCHDWYSAGVGERARRELHLPLVLHLHSTEHERAQGRTESAEAQAICRREQAAVVTADLILVPHSATRTVAVDLYGAPPEKVVVTDDPPFAQAGRTNDPGRTKARFQLNPAQPLVLYCGEISHAAGADLLVDSLSHVCRERSTVQFLFAGEGPLRRELEARVHHAGLGHRVRFVGDVARPVFEELINAADFVTVPARTWQDEGVARAAIAAGKPVLTTHQARLGCIQHGQNGLVAYDNPGSITWGLKELFSHPLSEGMRRTAAARSVGKSPDAIAAEWLIAYQCALRQQAASNSPAG